MNKLLITILLVALVVLTISISISPAYSADYPTPPQSPEEAWQPPLGGEEAINPPAGVESSTQAFPGLQILPPPTLAPGYPGSLTGAYLVNNRGQMVTTLYRNEAVYLVATFSGPGHFYLWEYYPSGYPSTGHWLTYRYYIGHAGIWKIGPFTAESFDPAGRYYWRMWFYSGSSWSTRSLSFYFTRSYYPPDIPGPIPGPVAEPVINAFSINKAAIEMGETVVLTWTTTNANNIKISPDIGTVATTGSTSITPVSTTTYTITAQNSAGKSVTSSATVVVNPRIAPTINTSQQVIDRGKTATISWNAPGAVGVSITGIGNVAKSGSVQVAPEETASYTITARYADGTTKSAYTSIIVNQPPYLLWILIGLAVIAAVVAAILIATRKRKVTPVPMEAAPATSAATGTATQAMRETVTEATHPTDVLPATTPILGSSATLALPDGSEILLAGNARSFGRHDFEKILPADQVSYISRQHINIWYEDSKYYIEDRSSTNGTRVNGVDIKGVGRRQLADGDVIDLASKLSINFKEINK